MGAPFTNDARDGEAGSATVTGAANPEHVAAPVAGSGAPSLRVVVARAPNEREGVAVVVVGPVGRTEATVAALRDVGCAVGSIDDPALLVELCKARQPHVIVVDVTAPRRSAFLAAAKYVCRNYGIPTMVVTEPDDVEARVQAIAFEADVAVSPLAPNEAVARVSSLVRRRRRDADSQRRAIGDISIDPSSGHVTRRGKVVHLTGRELDVLLMLIEHRDRTVSKEALLERVWQEGSQSVNAVEAQISSLRKKLHEHGPPLIHTIHGQGYSFRAVPIEVVPSHSGVLATRERRLLEREEALTRRAKLLRELERAHSTR